MHRAKRLRVLLSVLSVLVAILAGCGGDHGNTVAVSAAGQERVIIGFAQGVKTAESLVPFPLRMKCVSTFPACRGKPTVFRIAIKSDALGCSMLSFPYGYVGIYIFSSY